MWWVHRRESEQQLICKTVYGQKEYSGKDPNEAFQNNLTIYYKMPGDTGSEKFYLKKKVRPLKSHLGCEKCVCGLGKEEVTHSCRCAYTAGCLSWENKEGLTLYTWLPQTKVLHRGRTDLGTRQSELLGGTLVILGLRRRKPGGQGSKASLGYTVIHRIKTKPNHFLESLKLAQNISLWAPR